MSGSSSQIARDHRAGGGNPPSGARPPGWTIAVVPSPRMTRPLTLLFAVAGGAAVGNLYWAQPLLDEVARSLGVAQGVAGLLVTVTQVGYAVGIFLVVPLGDVLDRRRLVPGVLVASGLALLAAAAAPTWGLALAALALVGITSVGAQLLIPLAGDLADPEQRGRVVGWSARSPRAC